MVDYARVATWLVAAVIYVVVAVVPPAAALYSDLGHPGVLIAVVWFVLLNYYLF